MRSFVDLVRREAAVLRAQHERIHETLSHRSESAAGRAAWEEACERFHAYRSPMDPWLERLLTEPAYTAELLEFAIEFLEQDPRFFRSGYIKEELLRRLRRSPLGEAECHRLRSVLLDAVRCRGGREYRRYCRLAVRIADHALEQRLGDLLTAQGPNVVSRARMMLSYIGRHRQPGI